MSDLLSLRAFTGDDAPLVIAGLFLVLVGVVMLVLSLRDWVKTHRGELDRLLTEAAAEERRERLDAGIAFHEGLGKEALR